MQAGNSDLEHIWLEKEANKGKTKVNRMKFQMTKQSNANTELLYMSGRPINDDLYSFVVSLRGQDRQMNLVVQ